MAKSSDTKIKSTVSYFEDGDAAWNRGDLVAARRLFKAGAELGDHSCQNNYGTFIEAGLGGKQSISDAIAWYKRSAKRDPRGPAAINIADAYRKLNNHARAAYWFRRAMAAGDGDAALEYAEHLASLGRRGHQSKILSLLDRAIASDAITPDSRERALEWRAKLEGQPRAARRTR